MRKKAKVTRNRDIEEFKNYLREEELSENTIASYVRSVEKYLEFCKGNISKQTAIAFKQDLLTKNSANTVNLRICAVESYFKFTGENLGIKRIATQKRSYVQNVISIEQFNHLIDCLRSDGKYKYAAWFSIIAKTGARVSEFLQFTKADLDRGYKDLWTKGKVRRIMFPKSLISEVSEYYQDLSPNDSLCISRYGKPITDRGIDEALKDQAKRYGIPKEVAHCHSLRHLFAVEFLKRNNNISLLADLMGHSGVNTTMIYTRLSSEQQQEALDKAVDW